jgi:type I restriction enzyme, S subunit
MKSNYKPLGKYIQPVAGRNNDLGEFPLMGLSITKKFISSIANTIGTDMSTYRIIEKNQFAYGPVTSRNGDKITIALFNDYEKALISQAYIPFEVKNTNELNPEFLMMWFRRPEFDRYARFKSHGSAREIFDWEEMCNTLLPIPSITIQKEIVKEYNVIQNRITLNQQLIQKLEETAQAIYKQWFVDFEFPDENGNPYKITGGEMVFNEELEKEIPKSWEYNDLGGITIVNAGGDRPNLFSVNETDNLKIPIYSNSSVNEGIFGYTNEATVLKKSITISARGAIIGYAVLRTKPFVPIVRLIVVIPKHEYLLNYIFYCINNFKYNDSGSAQGQLTIPEISSFKVITPDSEILKKYQKITTEFLSKVELKKNENSKLEDFKNLLLSKLATIEN